MQLQHMTALQRANEVRLWRAEQRRRVSSGDFRYAAAMLLVLDDRIATLAIGDFLIWLPRVGRYRAEKIIKDCFPWHTSSTSTRSLGSLDRATRTRLAISIAQLKRPTRVGSSPPSLRDRVLSDERVSVTVG